MTVYIILFRGVGGATQLPTSPLREALAAAGFGAVRTYINSGNAVLASDLGPDGVAAGVARVCRDRFGFDKAIYAIPRAEWAALIAANPFPDAVATPALLHAGWLAARPEPKKVEAVRSAAVDGERLAVVGRVAYLHTPNGFGPSKMAVRFDKGIGVASTVRNWNTVRKLMTLADTTE